METINERFRQAREALRKSQDVFAQEAGRTRSEIKNIEYGKTMPKEEVVKSVCKTHGIDETWLRTGEGEMFLPKSRGEEIGQIVREAASVDPEDAVKFFQSLLDGMSDAEIVLMYQIFKKHFLGEGK